MKRTSAQVDHRSETSSEVQKTTRTGSKTSKVWYVLPKRSQERMNGQTSKELVVGRQEPRPAGRRGMRPVSARRPCRIAQTHPVSCRLPRDLQTICLANLNAELWVRHEDLELQFSCPREAEKMLEAQTRVSPRTLRRRRTSNRLSNDVCL